MSFLPDQRVRRAMGVHGTYNLGTMMVAERVEKVTRFYTRRKEYIAVLLIDPDGLAECLADGHVPQVLVYKSVAEMEYDGWVIE